jgi:hypothetical protein
MDKVLSFVKYKMATSETDLTSSNPIKQGVVCPEPASTIWPHSFVQPPNFHSARAISSDVTG